MVPVVVPDVRTEDENGSRPFVISHVLTHYSLRVGRQRGRET